MIFRPARSQAQEEQSNMKIICDFDSLVEVKVGFRFKGRNYIIKNVSVENYMQVTIAYKSLLTMVETRSQGEALDQDQVLETYFDLIKHLVPDFTLEDLRGLSFVLLNQLLSLILRQIAGDPSLYEPDQKKNPLSLISK